jgi:hypothetical protein
MAVTLSSGGSTYASTVRAGKPLTLQAEVKNTGNMPLQVTAHLTVPLNWDMDANPVNDCSESLEVSKTCLLTWYFTPQAAGQVILRVYVRGYYTDSAGGTGRVTRSPAFIFNVVPAKDESGGTSGGTAAPASSGLPNMAVTLISGSSTYASTVFAGTPLVLKAQVKNTGGVALGVTAHLTVPNGWDLEADPDSDCPESLESRQTCTINWSFTPQAEGQVFLRVYVRGTYTLASGFSYRITQSPAYIFNVKPAKVTE